jgi:hypothetical protein
MGKVVVEHYQSREEGLFRLVVADEVWHDVQTVQAREEHGDPVVETKPHFAGHANHEDFVFAAHDERWKGKKPTDIAKMQRELVAEALERRAAEQGAEEKRHRVMPGVGEEL